MSWLNSLRRLYSLETLDTRFVVSSSIPPRQAATELQEDPAKPSPAELQAVQQGRDGERSQKRGVEAHRSLWNTPEFYFYYFIFIIVVPQMFKAVVDVSKESHPNYPKFSPLLSDGWIPGRKVDNSDAQYAGFRANIPYLSLLVILHPLLRKVYDYLCRADTYTKVKPTTATNGHLTQGLSPSAAADARLEQRISFDVPFTAIFLTVLHGFSIFKILLIIYINYKIAKSLPREYIPVATWLFNLGTLFANELCIGYSYASIWQFLFRPQVADAAESVPFNPGAWLDSYGGILPRWEVLFNFTTLRLISFNMDYYWSLNMHGGSPIEKKQLDPSNLSERERINTPAKPTDYTFRTYFAYTLYSPLYLAGPILTFNDWISQLRYQPPSITRSRTAAYAIRFVVVLLTMEVMIHYMYMVAIFHTPTSWDAYTPLQLSMLGYFNLKHIWLKLLIPWRLFRLWALLDGVDPPENMVRCMSNNYSAVAFWRSWHRSFNRWTLRYIYIPLGGSGRGPARAVRNFLAVFTFVAIWHDIQLRLLMWGWLISLFVLPEVLARMAFPARRWRNRPTAYRILCAFGCTANILMMMAANLVGFAIGLDGLQDLAKSIVGSWAGLGFLASAIGALFVGTQVMFEVRESELRKGIVMKC